jgi:hypothetical protein
VKVQAKSQMLSFYRVTLQLVRVSALAFLAFCFASATPAQQQNSLTVANVHPPRAIVIGFMGGKVSPDDSIRNERIMSDRLRALYSRGVYFEVFENRRLEAAHQKILQLVGATPAAAAPVAGELSSASTRPKTEIILYGHSWGASAVVTLANELQHDGVPITLTIQVDSIEKKGQRDALIPANVARAINFYQPDGMLHGRTEIRAADPAVTQILGNIRFSYHDLPAECSLYPWYERKFIPTHIAIECDPVLWKRIEGLIRDSLGAPLTESAALR